MSVSSRKPKKKRNLDPNSWRKKIDEEGVRYLDEYRRAKLEAAEVSSCNLLDEMIAKTKLASGCSNRSEDYAILMKRLKAEDPIAAENIESQVKRAISSVNVLPVAELWEIISLSLEQAGPQGRRSLAIWPAILIHWLWGSYQDVRKRHFANATLTDRQFFWVLGTAIQNLGAPLKTGKLTPTTKGRINAELLEAISEIRGHERVRLTYRELKDTLQYAQIHVPSEEHLRIFVHRAKRKQWL